MTLPQGALRFVVSSGGNQQIFGALTFTICKCLVRQAGQNIMENQELLPVLIFLKFCLSYNNSNGNQQYKVICG
jgi:hypothetical protein